MEYNIYAKRRRQLAAKLDKDTVAVLRADHDKLRNGDTLYPFRQNSNFYYLCGINEPDLVMVLLIGKTVKEYLFIPRQNETRKSWEGEKVSLDKARALSGISNVYYLDELVRMAPAWLRHALLERLLEPDAYFIPAGGSSVRMPRVERGSFSARSELDRRGLARCRTGRP